MKNSVKDEIKLALELAGYRQNQHNIELVYQTYFGSKAKSIGNVIKELKGYLNK